MSEEKKVTPPSPIQNAIGVIMRAAQRNNLAGVAQAMAGIANIFDMGLMRQQGLIMQIINAVNFHAANLESHQLQLKLLQNLLKEKDIVSEEEMKERIKTDVEDELRKREEEAAEEAQKAQEEIENKIKEAKDELKKEAEEELDEEEPESDVILASEREGSVVTFPRKTD